MGTGVARDEKNLFGYLAREFETLAQRPIGEVDSLVLACLSYFRWPGDEVRGHEGMAVRDLFRAECFHEMTQGLWDPEGLVRLLAAVAASPRFRDVRVCEYVDDFDESAEKQFSACTLRLPAGGAYLSFRGTDNTVVGWKEDFNMAFETGVPSQRAALAYLERVSPMVEGPLYLGGHSKGGNLAVYATARCPEAENFYLRQAFKTAGQHFSVFEEETTDILVPYEEGRRLLAELDSERCRSDASYRAAVLKKLSPFTVSVYQYQKKWLEKARALFPVCGGCALALAEEFYDAEVGLKAE